MTTVLGTTLLPICRCYILQHLDPFCNCLALQALQKLHALVSKAESLSSEALRTTQAESARAAQAEAVRSAQTEAVIDSLLKFKQVQAAELAKRDAVVAELQRSVAKLHTQQQGGSERQGSPADRQSQTAEGQQGGLVRQEDPLKGQQSGFERQEGEPKERHPALIAQQDPVHGHGQVEANAVGSHKAAAGAAKGSFGRSGTAAGGPLKGRTRQSTDGKISRQGPKVAVRAKATSSGATACLPQGGLSTHTDLQQRHPFTELLENEVCIFTKLRLIMFCLEVQSYMHALVIKT